jgi:putative ABC transport system permease protein
MGFSIENVWSIEARALGNLTEEGSEERADTLEQYMDMLKGMDEVKAVGLISHFYLWMGHDYGQYEYEKSTVSRVREFFMDDGCMDVLNIDVISGRWFDTSDDEAGIAPVIINKKLREMLFPEEDPIGKIVDISDTEQKRRRVIGVVSDFRHYGPFDGLRPAALQRQHVKDKMPPLSTHLIFKTHPDVKAGFRVRLLDALQSIERSWSIHIRSYEKSHERHIKYKMRWIYSLFVIAIAVVAMAVFGLITVLWQNARKRIQEIGLRRAKGATIMHIFQQIAGEFLIVSTFAIALGLILILQIQYFDVFSFIPDKVYCRGMFISTAVVYVLTILIVLYPSISAARIQPADALHYE